MVLSHIIKFLVDFFTNLNLNKIIGAILFIIGLALIGLMGSSGNANIAVIYAVIGIAIGGVGAIIIYYDFTKDNVGIRYNELDTLSKAQKQKQTNEKNVVGWHIDDESESKK
jgi:hypothetical protein